MAGEVSDHAVVSQVARIYPGMMKAVPPRRWPDLSDRPAAEVAALLNELAVRVPVERMLRSAPRAQEAEAAAEARGIATIISPPRSYWTRPRGCARRRRDEAQPTWHQEFDCNDFACWKGWVAPIRVAGPARCSQCTLRNRPGAGTSGRIRGA